jgi:glycosyltransferase involved in cell wall biosynthesis
VNNYKRHSECPRILVTCSGRVPSVELGAIIPLSELQKRSLCVFEYKDEYFLSISDIAKCDILFIVRGCTPRSVWAAQEAKNLGRHVLGYWDDNLLGLPEESPLYSYYESPETKCNLNKLFGLTECYFSPNAKLAAKLSSAPKCNAKVIPYPSGSGELKPPGKRTNNIPVIGYAASTVHANKLQTLLVPAASAITEAGIKFRFHVMGPQAALNNKVASETVYTPYVRDYNEYLNFSSKLNWDIGLAPQSDNEFTRFKYHNKLIEYTHIGCAGIYSRLEPYVNVIEDGVTGLLVNNNVDEWKDAIIRLIKDPDLRYKIAINAYEYVQIHHNREVVARGYSEALAPFFINRAPDVARAHVILDSVTSSVSFNYQSGLEYFKKHGLRRFSKAALSHLFSTFRRK